MSQRSRLSRQSAAYVRDLEVGVGAARRRILFIFRSHLLLAQKQATQTIQTLQAKLVRL